MVNNLIGLDRVDFELTTNIAKTSLYISPRNARWVAQLVTRIFLIILWYMHYITHNATTVFIVLKPDPVIDPIKWSGHGSDGLTQVNKKNTYKKNA